MRTTPPRPDLTPNAEPSVSVPHALRRPWSAPKPAYRGLKGFFVGLAMGAVCTGLAAAGWSGVGFTTKASLPEAVSPAAAQLASVGCSYRIEPETHRELVVDTDVAGRIVVWHKGREWRSYVAPASDVEYFNLKRRHRDVSHFRVAVVATRRKHNDEQVTWCRPIG